MARSQKLKVFKTPIGFHDAYVAAPSRKAALEAWGADSNLFATGGAEEVDDAELSKEPLANPGEVVRRLRGSLDEHIAALPSRRLRAGGKQDRPATAKRPRKPKPRPKRDALDRAEAQLAELERGQATALGELARKQAALDLERRALEKHQAGELQKARKGLIAAREKYAAAMERWRAD